MKKTKKQVQGELIYGINPVVELLKAKRRKIISIYTTKPEPKGWKRIQEVMPKYPVPIQYVERDILNRMADSTDHQSVVAWVQSFGFRKKFFDPTKQSFLVMLDGIQDPRNLGAILRSAYCTGADGVILTKKGAAPLNAAALKASAGLAEYLEIYMAPSAVAAAQELKSAGYQMYMAAFDGKNATEIQYNMPLCLVIGGEGYGISPQIMNMGTHITLPQKSADISYNASVAAGILLFLVSSQHKKV
jgi:23S rRNA (guanosine2251-2'-O)-methyltransferase